MSTLEVEIKPQIIGGQLFGYHLLTKRGDSHWSGTQVFDTAEMRQIAKALIDKANEIERV